MKIDPKQTQELIETLKRVAVVCEGAAAFLASLVDQPGEAEPQSRPRTVIKIPRRTC